MRAALAFVKENYKHPLKVAEIGVAEGLHAIELYENLNIDRLILIDIWSIYTVRYNIAASVHELVKSELTANFISYYDKVKNLFANKNNVDIIKGASLEVAQNFEDNSFDFVYIDASHDYKDVLADLECWYAKVKPGGVLAGHDYCLVWDEVKLAVDEFVKLHNLMLNIDKNFEINDFHNWDWWIIK